MPDYKYYKRSPGLAPWRNPPKAPYSVLLPVCAGGTITIAIALWQLADGIYKLIA